MITPDVDTQRARLAQRLDCEGCGTSAHAHRGHTDLANCHEQAARRAGRGLYARGTVTGWRRRKAAPGAKRVEAGPAGTRQMPILTLEFQPVVSLDVVQISGRCGGAVN